jgi:hypothetical protein
MVSIGSPCLPNYGVTGRTTSAQAIIQFFRHGPTVDQKEEEQLLTSPNSVQTLWYILKKLSSNLTRDELDPQSTVQTSGPNSETKNADYKLRWNPDRCCQATWLVTVGILTTYHVLWHRC